MYADAILKNINEIFCPNDPGHPLRGKEMSRAKILKHGYIAIKDDKILSIGEGDFPKDLINENTEITDCSGCVASPGIIDAHTHLVYGGTRENEFRDKLNGVTYLEILEKGGGILSTVKATRKASFDELYTKTEKLLTHMMIHGVTTVEAKSGYGLDLENEIKMLKVIKKLKDNLPVDLISTFMAAHAVPAEYKNNPDAYVDEVIKMIPEIKKQDLAEFCDVFCEKNVFTAEQSEKILSCAKKNGMKLRIHSDEIADIGGTEVAAKLHAVSAEHLMVVSDDAIDKMAKAGVIANLLPGTTFSLMEDTFAPAKKMIEKNMAFTLCTDSNPGSCPMANMQFIMQLGCFAYKLTPIEVYNAVTINAAYSVDRACNIGSFDIGKQADITLFEAPTLDYTLYFFATNLCKAVYKNGKLTVKDRRLL